MGISNWFYHSLSHLGLYWPNKPAKLVFVGLDNAGKSSLLRNYANNLPGLAVTTSHHHPGLETLIKGNVSFTALDVGGHHHQDHELWTEETICGASGVVFMVDEAAAELHALDAAEGLEGVPFLVLGNKIDHPGASTLIKFPSVCWKNLIDVFIQFANLGTCAVSSKQSRRRRSSGIDFGRTK